MAELEEVIDSGSAGLEDGRSYEAAVQKRAQAGTDAPADAEDCGNASLQEQRVVGALSR